MPRPSPPPIRELPVVRWALLGLLVGSSASIAWVGWCSLTVASAVVLARWIPLDAALALIGSLHLAGAVALVRAGVRAWRGPAVVTGGTA